MYLLTPLLEPNVSQGQRLSGLLLVSIKFSFSKTRFPITVKEPSLRYHLSIVEGLV